MKSLDFINMAKHSATGAKTLYVMGCFGSPMNATNKSRYCNNYAYNQQAVRTAKIKAASTETFGFDCVCLIKGILWGWNADINKTYGGAVYASSSVPDYNADQFFTSCCTNQTSDFSKIEPGELVWMNGHIGIYIGDGMAVESTPIWKDGAQITGVKNIGNKTGYNMRTWAKHGKCKFIEYSAPLVNGFLPKRGWLQEGDSGSNVEKICTFWRKFFPMATTDKVLGNYFGPNCKNATIMFQKMYDLETDGAIGPLTLAQMKKVGFKE